MIYTRPKGASVTKRHDADRLNQLAPTHTHATPTPQSMAADGEPAPITLAVTHAHENLYAVAVAPAAARRRGSLDGSAAVEVCLARRAATHPEQFIRDVAAELHYAHPGRRVVAALERSPERHAERMASAVARDPLVAVLMRPDGRAGVDVQFTRPPRGGAVDFATICARTAELFNADMVAVAGSAVGSSVDACELAELARELADPMWETYGRDDFRPVRSFERVGERLGVDVPPRDPWAGLGGDRVVALCLAVCAREDGSFGGGELGG